MREIETLRGEALKLRQLLSGLMPRDAISTQLIATVLEVGADVCERLDRIEAISKTKNTSRTSKTRR